MSTRVLNDEPGFERFLLQAGRFNIHARVSRSDNRCGRPAVVMVHGLGLSGRYMLPTARAMIHEHRVFLPDFPGFGDSDKPAETLDVAGLADSLAEWIKQARIGRRSGSQLLRLPDVR